MTDLPIISIPQLFHIGTLNPADRGARGESQEGHLLSVSSCPHAWRQIAKLGGAPLHRLDKAGGNRFLDVWAAQDKDLVRSQIEGWALEHGFVERKTLWKAWSPGEYDDDWRFSFYQSQGEALQEVGQEGDEPGDIEGPDGAPGIAPVVELVGTPKLAQRVSQRDLGTSAAFDFAALVWAEDTQPQLDGVWWAERYDPDCLSAPRGGIFPRAQSAFTAAEVDWVAVSDDTGNDCDEEDDELVEEGER